MTIGRWRSTRPSIKDAKHCPSRIAKPRANVQAIKTAVNWASNKEERQYLSMDWSESPQSHQILKTLESRDLLLLKAEDQFRMIRNWNI